MADTRTNLGIVLPGFAGEYDPGRSYDFYEFVRDGNDSFIAKRPSTGVPTGNSEYWYRVTGVGPTPSIEIDGVTTLGPGEPAAVVNVGNDRQVKLRFAIPEGAPGQNGNSATFSIVQTITGDPDSPATVTEAESSTALDRQYVVTLPAGRQGVPGTDGNAGTIAIGEVRTGLPGTNATIENVGTPTHAILNITIPAGSPGMDGDGSGDMVRATYDTNGNGIVDNAEKLGGRLPEYYAPAAEMAEKAPLAHTHPAGEVNGLEEALASKSDGTHGHDGYAAIDHNHDAKYLQTETDPTVPAWAKAPAKPVYTKTEVGLGNVDNTSDANSP